MVFTNYGFISGAIEGQPATAVNSNTRSFLNGTGATIAFGRAVIWDATNDQIELPSATGEKFMGVVVRSTIYENAFDAAGDAGYPDEREMNVLTSGDIWVYTETAVAPNDPVFFRHTASGGNTAIGRFRTDADTATCDEITTVARWAGVYGAGGLAKLTLNVG